MPIPPALKGWPTFRRRSAAREVQRRNVMHTHRITVGFITVLVMAGCLVLRGFAAPAAAKTIVVTTLGDIANPPFDADGPCGTGTLKDLPGADSLVSLREAIIAANNTPGADTITF